MLREKIRLPDDPEISGAILRDMAQAVINQAITDIKDRRIQVQLSAALFLSGPDLPIWLAAAIGEDPKELKEAGLTALTSGVLKKDKKRLIND